MPCGKLSKSLLTKLVISKGNVVHSTPRNASNVPDIVISGSCSEESVGKSSIFTPTYASFNIPLLVFDIKGDLGVGTQVFSALEKI